ncbi:short-chain dehydrogenase [Corynebacterium phocae]|uniref:Short-chain dehydrogenase n=1 Tax=Corynebacterium phocae TaxID=161895 RepID=A0A1L7D1T6_9CORY|nr:SDR family oxidoreductase [Corynebacterium phocae]APT92050.1 short-chain dehydrogenase [Corynebacterium phocae]KAA8726434.1 SDR family oxidoreductase [Corynebacterium phocae]
MKSKIAVVTGATGGMGTEIVDNLSTDHHVYALSRSASGHFADNPNVTAVDVDLVEALDGGYPLPNLEKVDVLVHAAAGAEKFSVESAGIEDWRFYMDLNVHAPAVLTATLLPALRAAGGTVIFINSGAGRHSYADNVVYASTKHALYAVADSLRLAEEEIRVSTVAPGPTDTPMLAGLMDYKKDEVIAPVEVANAIRYVVDAGKSAQITEVHVRPRVELK